ncbi:long-chain fatty acid--CoA ligase [Adhaeribacter arboris]|uniref:Long-chain fatty acid--CoA ligase n=1 Tax=Adhaeribacter arboris TaxID=2072846 RepID=A0A2T2YKH2_9BACT|nr:long-chain fatty acid--CoA ligase [Adhaeribacter arboris]PSR56014.1 long-chain fatty acid--CoA ligase [Adhaeribacter arboris]
MSAIPQITRAFDILAYQLQKYPQTDCLAAKINGAWQTQSTQQVKDAVDKFSLGLLANGIKKNDKIALVSFNRPEWIIADLGIQQMGAVSVPMYPTITEEDYRYIFKEAEVKLILVSDEKLYNRVSAATAQIEGIQGIYSFDHLTGVKHWSEISDQYKAVSAAELEASKAAITSKDLFTIIYTSGTTGNPKGVMLTHHNIVSNYTSCQPYVPVNNQHRALSFLPLCHIYERMLSVLYIAEGVSIYYAESIEKVADNLREVKPHVFATVPRLLEKVYDKIVAKGRELTGVKKSLFFWALELGLKYDVRGTSAWYNAQLAIANKIIFNKWREALGGNVIAIVSGGAALQPRLARVFGAANIRVMEGYGLTETSPVIAVNRHNPEDHMIGTVGPPVDDIEVKIAESDGEILTRSASVMKGYYKHPEQTAEVIDADGWFHTGDIGELVEGKYLRITDRKKEMFKTSGGKYIAPQLIENKLKESVLIEQVMVIGDGRKFASALIVPSFPDLREWCRLHNIPYTTDAEMIKHPEVLAKYDKEVKKYNEHFAQWEQIKRHELLSKLWSIESGELTAKLSLKRKVILQNNQELIEKIY